MYFENKLNYFNMFLEKTNHLNNEFIRINEKLMSSNRQLPFDYYLSISSKYFETYEYRQSLINELDNVPLYESNKIDALKKNIDKLYSLEVDIANEMWIFSINPPENKNIITEATIFNPKGSKSTVMLENLLAKHDNNYQNALEELEKTINSRLSWFWLSKFSEFKSDDTPIVIKHTSRELFDILQETLNGFWRAQFGRNNMGHTSKIDLEKKLFNILDEYFNLPFHEEKIDGLHDFVKSILGKRKQYPRNKKSCFVFVE